MLLPPLRRWATEAQGKTGWDLVSDKTPTSMCPKYRCLPTQWVSTLSLQPVEINRVWRVTELDKCRCLLWDASHPDFPVTHHLFLRENIAKSLKCWAMGPVPWGHDPHDVHYGLLYALLSYPMQTVLPDGHHSLESSPKEHQEIICLRLDTMFLPHRAAASSGALSC